MTRKLTNAEKKMLTPVVLPRTAKQMADLVGCSENTWRRRARELHLEGEVMKARDGKPVRTWSIFDLAYVVVQHGGRVF